MDTIPTPTPESVASVPKKRSFGGILAIVLILVLIIIGAFYAWGERIAEQDNLSPEEQQILNDLENQGNSTDPSAIEADLNAETSEEFNAELDQAFTEMDAAFEAQ